MIILCAHRWFGAYCRAAPIGGSDELKMKLHEFRILGKKAQVILLCSVADWFNISGSRGLFRRKKNRRASQILVVRWGRWATSSPLRRAKGPMSFNVTALAFLASDQTLAPQILRNTPMWHFLPVREFKVTPKLSKTVSETPKSRKKYRGLCCART